MKKSLLLCFFVFFYMLAQAQCDYLWKSRDNHTQLSNYLISPNLKFDSLNRLLSKVIGKAKIIRIDEKTSEWFDSLQTGKIDDTAYMPYIGKAFFARGRQEGWLEIKLNNVGYLLTH